MTPLEALQQALAGEHAALYVYGVLGARVSASADPDLATRLSSAYAVHRGRRDQLTSMVRTAHGSPVAAHTSYEVPTPARTAAQITTAARVVEQRCADVYAETVGATSRSDRQWAIDALLDAAVRQLSFGAGAERWPGVAEL